MFPSPSPSEPKPNPSSRATRLTLLVSWLVPALFFTVSGIAKIVSPEGEIPVLVSGWIEPDQYPSILRALGGFELVLAALLVPPAARRLGRPLAGLVLLGFVGLIALSFGDPEFLSHCGCLGGLGQVSPGSLFASPYWILGRDMALIWLIALGWSGETGGGRPLGPALRVSAGLTLILALGSVAGGEWYAGRQVHALLAAMEEGRPRSGSLGWTFPDLPLLDDHGRKRSSHDVLLGGETVLIFSPDCPDCRREAPGWPALGRAVESSDGRLVLLGAGPPSRVAHFLDQAGAAALEHYMFTDAGDAFRAGVFDVPHILELDALHRVVRQQGVHDPGGLAQSLASLLGRDPEAARALCDVLARRLFGGDAHCDVPVEHDTGIVSVPVRASGQATRTMVIVATRGDLPVVAELVVGIGPWGGIQTLLPLRWDTGPPDISGPDALLAGLEKTDLSKAWETAREEARHTGPQASDWKTIAHLLGRTVEALR